MPPRSRSLRGTIGAGESLRLILDDGRYKNGYVIKSFQVWSPTFNNNGHAVLSYKKDAPSAALADDGNQIAWAAYADGTVNTTSSTAVIDPNHVVNQDLFVHGFNASLSFLVVIEPITMTDAQGLLQLVKASRQDEP
tara:strand:- start:783 stop:1193 length:411 start_codon:yes stop_codon:yes gene_type:complete